jgi:hypothetical protein
MKPQGFIPPSASPSAHEAADLDVPKILRVVTIIAGTLLASILVLILFFRHMEQNYPARTSEAAPQVAFSQLPPNPRVQANPMADLLAVRKAEDSHLNQYRWVDQQHSVAQIPVDRAMALWVKSYSATAGPAYPAASATNTISTPSGPNELQMRQQKAQESQHAP